MVARFRRAKGRFATFARALAIAGALVPATFAPAARAEDFYRGKTLTVAIGAPAGGIYDITARLYARHIANFIPGAPTVVVQNMPGAAGLRAANWLYNAAPKDGTSIALSLDNLLLSQVLSPADVKYRSGKFNWIGRGDKPTRVLFVWTASGLRSLDDVRKREVLVGVTAPGTASELYPSMTNALLGTKFRMINGYAGAGGLNIALERGEIEAVGANAWVNLVVTKPEWVRDGKVRPLFQTSLARDPVLPDTPTLLELAETDAQREIIRFEARSEEIGYYLIAPPETPADRVEILRAAFAGMTGSPAYLAEAKRLDMGTGALSGRDLQEIAELVESAPAGVVKGMRDAASPKN